MAVFSIREISLGIEIDSVFAWLGNLSSHFISVVLYHHRVRHPMSAQVHAPIPHYIVHDTRSLREIDLVYHAAVRIADEIMEGIDGLIQSNTIEVATLFITDSGAQLIIIAGSFDARLIAPAFRSTLKSMSFDAESGYHQKYVIPILEYDEQIKCQ